jgi:VanZ family protein
MPLIIAPENPKRLLRGLWLIAVLVVIVGSLLPGNSLPIEMLGRLQISDKIEHLVAYAALGFLPSVHERWKVAAVMLLAAVAMGVGLEFGQLLSPGRQFEIADMLADALGVCFGLAAGTSVRSYSRVGSFLNPGGQKLTGGAPSE